MPSSSFRFIPESIRWLRLNGGTDTAMDILRRVAEVNGKDLHEIKLAPPPVSVEERKANPLDLARPKRMLIQSITLSFAW